MLFLSVHSHICSTFSFCSFVASWSSNGHHTYRQQVFTLPYKCRSRGLSRWQEERTCHLLLPRNKNLSRKSLHRTSVWAEGGLMASEMQGWRDKGTPCFFSSYFGRWARRRRGNQQPKRLSHLTSSVSFFPSTALTEVIACPHFP